MTRRGSRVIDAAGRHPGGVVCGLCAVLVAGGIAVHGQSPSPDGAARDGVRHAAAVSGGPAAAGAATPAPTFRSVRTYPAVAEPVRLRIPSIGVKTDLQHLGL